MYLSKYKFIFLFLSVFLTNSDTFAEEPNQTNRVLQFETKDVKVWKTIIMPHDPLKMHRHDNKRIVVALTDTDLKVINDNGTSSCYHWPKGTAHFLDTDKPNTFHADINESDQAMEVMVIQFLN